MRSSWGILFESFFFGGSTFFGVFLGGSTFLRLLKGLLGDSFTLKVLLFWLIMVYFIFKKQGKSFSRPS